MPAKTDFDVSPYWDDWTLGDDFYRVLFRPGFAVQARELTTLQTILQNQIEQFGDHMFKHGAQVIPGAVTYDSQYYAVKVQSTYSTGTLSDYLGQYVGATITGATSGVTAVVVNSVVTDGTDPDTLFVKYINTSTVDNVTQTFTNNELISSSVAITAAGSSPAYAIDAVSAQLAATSATATGTSVSIDAGIYFIRGFMIQNLASTIILDKYTNTPSYRVGWTITETLVTPEMDPSLLDNATGSSNYAAKGAHRFRMRVAIGKKTLTTTDDSDFIELIRLENGLVQNQVRSTQYSVVADMLARRTDDESGDYIVKHFDLEPRENLDNGTNRGIYTAANGGVESKITYVASPGKAYVNGFELETIAPTYITANKARDTNTKNNENIPFNLGNFVNVTKIYGSPDTTDGSQGLSTVDVFKDIKLYDQQTSTRGSTAGALVGVARSRGFEYSSGTVGASASNATSIYRHYLFDITMFTNITTSSATYTTGAVLTGADSKATGIVYAGGTGTTFQLMQTVGTFSVSEVLTSSKDGDSQTDTLSAVSTKQLDRDVKQIYMAQTAGTDKDYTADTALDTSKNLTGQVTYVGSGTTISGQNTAFTTELVIGDIVSFPSGAAGAAEQRRVTAVTDATTITVASALTNSLTTSTAARKRTTLNEQEELILVYKMPRDDVKTLLDSSNVSDTTFTVRRTFVGTTDASSQVSFTAGSGESFDAYSNANYTMMKMTAGSGSAAVGDIVSVSGNITGTSSGTITITDSSALGTSCQIKLIATVTIAVANQKTKTSNKCTQATVAKNDTTSGSSSDIYGARVGDKEIGLTYSDSYKLRAVYESSGITTAAVAPTLTIASSTGTFTPGETITGTVTAATGVVILNSPSTSLSYVITSGTFSTLDTISGGTSGYTATVSAVAVGDTNITSRFKLDTGQRDSYYDISRIVRNPDALIPTGRLLVIHDYFGHSGSGDYFSVDSYANAVDYADIPAYNATKVDPETLAPKGFYELRDSLDFRPAVANNAAGSTNPFSFSSRAFEGTGSSTGDLVVPDDNIRMDFTFYLPRWDLMFLTSEGNFKIVEGVSDEDPYYPDATNTSAMKLATIQMQPYTYKADDLKLTYVDNRRYTMRDIGLLDRRIANLEYYTSLALLERDTASFQIQDANGLDRFKSGFIVDNFYGHNIGDSQNPDYNCSVAPRQGHLRPETTLDNIALVEENTTDAERTADNYAKTGDLITLPYTHTASITQPYSSRVESINPFLVTHWVGNITLNPASDIWIDTNRVPELIIDVEGNYEQMLRTNKNAFGTVWGAWEDFNTGTETTRKTEQWRQGWDIMERSVDTVQVQQVMTGAHTRLQERIQHVNIGDRILNIEIIPWMRPKDITFVGENFKPNTRLYSFFDGTNVNAFSKPTGSSAGSTTTNGSLTKTDTTVTVVSTTGFPTTGTIKITSVSGSFTISEDMIYTGVTSTTFTGITRAANNTTVAEHATAATVSGAVNSMPMITNSLGQIYGTYALPNTDTVRFRVGEKMFRMTDSSTNSLVPGVANTAGNAVYLARGTIETRQAQINAVRNAEVVVDTVTETQVITREVAGTAVTRQIGSVPQPDPLAQTFMSGQEGGEFLTKCDIYFFAKETNRPVTMQIRTVVNGYPSKTILPFSTVVKQASDITVTSDATTATTFTFPSPVYIQQGVEYCVVLLGNTKETKVWISRLGEIDTGGVRAISEQPHLGSLFKSQNASTWTASQNEDLKFTMYRATFDNTLTGTYTIVNEELTVANKGISTLAANPLETSNGTATVKVNFPNHGMYDTDNNVIIDGVKSEVSNSALNGAITDSATSIVLDDTSNFPEGHASALAYIKIDQEIITYTSNNGTTTLGGCTRAVADGSGVATTAAAHEDNSVVELFMIATVAQPANGGIPLTEINKTHTSISGLELDSFIITTTTNAASSLVGGGSAVTCTKNIPMDLMYAQVQTMELANTAITATAQTTTGRSVNTTSTVQNAFTPTALASAFNVPLNKNFQFALPQIICSQINETNEPLLAGIKSFKLNCLLTSSVSNLSPIIDEQRRGVITVGNRVNQINSAANLGSLTVPYIQSTEPTGDQNAAIYMTKKVTLKNAATALRIILDGVIMDEANVKVLFKTLRTDTAEEFDDIGWTYFNTNGTSDSLVPISKEIDDFKEHQYSVSSLSEFIAFSIKIVMQGTNSARPPLIKDFRAIALAL